MGREQELQKLFETYISQVRNYMLDKPNPDDKLMRSIEDKLGLHPAVVQEHRTVVLCFVRSARAEGKPFNYKSDKRLYQALCDLLEERQDS